MWIAWIIKRNEKSGLCIFFIEVRKSSFQLGTFFTKIIKLMESNPSFDCRKGLDKWHETISKYSGRFYDVKLKGRRCLLAYVRSLGKSIAKTWNISVLCHIWFSLGTYEWRRRRRRVKNEFIFYFDISHLLGTIQCVCRY